VDVSVEVVDVECRAGEVTAHIAVGGEVAVVRWRGERVGAPPSGVGSAMVPTTLLPAMAVGTRLDPGGPVSPRQLRNVDRAQEIFLTWDRYAWQGGLQRVTVDAPGKDVDVERAEGVGCFFSGGVDSFFSALRHRDEITHLIHVRGCELVPLDSPLDRRVRASVLAAAAELGKPVLEVVTDVRRFSDRYVGWDRYHGGALATVALLLASTVGKAYVPASDTWATLRAWGTYPALDGLWGTEQLRLVHDGNDVSRADKIASFEGEPVPLRWLQVCWQAGRGAYNCGRCDKCVRTMAFLRMAGLLDACRTFPEGIDLRLVAKLDLSSPAIRMYWRRYLARLDAAGTDPALARAIRRALSPRRQHLSIEAQRLARRPRIAGALRRGRERWRGQRP
jgi:hypothetical protein